MNPRTLLDFLHIAEKLKSNIRHSETSDGVPESAAAHSWRLCLFACSLKDEFPDIVIDKVIKICIIHDLGESIVGDIPSFNKTEDDSKIEFEKTMAMFRSFPAPIDTEFAELYIELESLTTREARLYKALDKLEAVIQHNEADILSWLPLEYELNKPTAMSRQPNFRSLKLCVTKYLKIPLPKSKAQNKTLKPTDINLRALIM